jgi:NTE family protein
MPKSKIGFALGGGAARGLAHIGVLKVMTREGIVPDYVVGTSIGAVVGALFVTHLDTGEVIDRARSYFEGEHFGRIKFDFLKHVGHGARSDGLFDALGHYLRKSFFYNITLARQSFVSTETFLRNIAALVDDISIQDARIPFAAVCTDIHGGEEAVLTEGPLRTAVAASAAIPGVFPPIEFGGRLLADGGWVNQLPAGPCRRLGADVVIAVDVAMELEQDYSVDTGLDIIRRVNAITRYRLTALSRRDADVVITPQVGQVNWTSFSCIEECILRGEEAAEKALSAIRKVLSKKKR